MDYIIVIRPVEAGGYWADVAVQPGCFAQGKLTEDLLGDGRGAIASTWKRCARIASLCRPTV